LNGTVTMRGAVVPNAWVTATNKDTGFTVTSSTGADGRYGFLNLPVGNYTLTVVVVGFTESVLQGVIVSIGQSTTANVDLSAGPPPRVRAKKGAPRPAPDRDRIADGAAPPGAGPDRITGRDFLLRDEDETDGYGLYSYLLFGMPPTDATRDRYVQAMQAYLRFSEVKDLRKYVPIAQLNVTYVPLLAKPRSLEAKLLVDTAYYNYPRSQAFLAKFVRQSCVPGPCIASTAGPLTKAAQVTDKYLFQDLSSVPPEIVVLWVQEFVEQSAQEGFWRERNGPQVALKLRTAIARLAAGIVPGQKSAKDWQSILSTLLFWKGE
jgi:hypothetical protein